MWFWRWIIRRIWIGKMVKEKDCRFICKVKKFIENLIFVYSFVSKCIVFYMDGEGENEGEV